VFRSVQALSVSLLDSYVLYLSSSRRNCSLGRSPVQSNATMKWKVNLYQKSPYLLRSKQLFVERGDDGVRCLNLPSCCQEIMFFLEGDLLSEPITCEVEFSINQGWGRNRESCFYHCYTDLLNREGKPSREIFGCMKFELRNYKSGTATDLPVLLHKPIYCCCLCLLNVTVVFQETGFTCHTTLPIRIRKGHLS
jgi:hypothetical protein